MKWVLSIAALAPLAYIAFFYFTLRSSRDSMFGSAWTPAYAATEWIVALAFMLVAAALLFVIHGAKGQRLRKAALVGAGFAFLMLSSRDLHYMYQRGEIAEASLGLLRLSHGELGHNELMCFALSDFGVTVRSPDTGVGINIFRGIWPFAFEAEEMDRILSPC